MYPKGALLLNARGRAAEKYGVEFAEDATVYIADSARDVGGGPDRGGALGGRGQRALVTAGELRGPGADVVLGRPGRHRRRGGARWSG